jgi:hypothetical protein
MERDWLDRVLRGDPKGETIVQTVHIRPRTQFPPDFDLLGVAVAAGAAWVTPTIGS